MHRLWTQESSQENVSGSATWRDFPGLPTAARGGQEPSDPAASLTTHGRSVAPAAELPGAALRSRRRGAPQRPAAPHRQRLSAGRPHHRAGACAHVPRRGGALGDHDGRAPGPTGTSQSALRPRAARTGGRPVSPLAGRSGPGRHRSAGRPTSGAAGGPAASTRPRSDSRAGCRACRRGSSTTSCSTSSRTWSRRPTARSSGRCWSPIPTSRVLEPFWTESPGRTATRPLRTTRPTPRTSPPRRARQ